MFTAARRSILTGLALLMYFITTPTLSASGAIDDVDQRVEALKAVVIDVSARLGRRKQSIDCPDRSRINFYVDVPLAELSVLEAVVTLDDRSAIHHSFTPIESTTLSRGGLFLLGCFDVEPGLHKVHAALTWTSGNVSPQKPTNIEYDGVFEKSGPSIDCQVSLLRPGYLSSPEIRLRLIPLIESEDGNSQPLPKLLAGIGRTDKETDRNGSDERRIQAARFLSDTGKSFRAALSLTHMAFTAPSIAPDYYRELAHAELRLGIIRGAQQLYRLALNAGAPPSDLVDLRLDIAESFYRRGDFDQAGAELLDFRRIKDKGAFSRWQDLQSRVLLAQGDYRKAREVLLSMENKADYKSYVRYFNLGIALLRDGHEGQAVTALDRVGGISSSNELLNDLRDKANLTLGYHFLRHEQGATAVPIFGRIAGTGPFSNTALLGLGWAWLAPAGRRQGSLALGDEVIVGPPPEAITGRLPSTSDRNLYQRFRISPFTQADIDVAEDRRLKHALAAWVRLIDRDPADPAVQEGFVAIAFALDRLGAHEGAAQYYEKAVSMLESTKSLLSEAKSYVEDDHWDELIRQASDSGIDAGWTLEDLPNPRLSVYVQDTLASNRFQASIRRYRDLRLLQGYVSKLKAFVEEHALGPPASRSRPSLEQPDMVDKWAVAIEQVASPEAATSYDPDTGDELVLRLAELGPSLAACLATEKQNLQSIVLEDLDSQIRRNDQLLARARDALATIYDSHNAMRAH